MAKRKRYLFVCVNERPLGTPKGSCATRDSVAIHAALKAEIALRKLAATEVRTCTSSCLDVCWAGPAILVEPDHVFYGRVTLEDVPAIADALASGTTVDRLLLSPGDSEQSTAGASLPERAKEPVKSGG